MIYAVLFGISLALTIIYIFLWHKHYDVHFSLIYTFIPIGEVALFLQSISKTIEGVIITQKIVYLTGCFLPLFITLSILHLCKVKPNRILVVVMFMLNMLVYGSVLTIGYLPFFYKSCDFGYVNGIATVVDKEYGPMHGVFYGMIALYLGISIGTMIFTYLHRKDVSRKILWMLFIPELLSVIGYFGGFEVVKGVQNFAFTYVLAQLFYLFIIYRVCLYDVEDALTDSLVETGDTGLISIDFKLRYLGANEVAKSIFPTVANLPVDKTIIMHEDLRGTLVKWGRDFSEDETKSQWHYAVGEKFYKVDVRYLYVLGKRCGYQFFFADDTNDQKYINLLDSYNAELTEEVEKQTKHIREMHDNLIMSMATMVESRDNSTGGHITRTSEVVRILVGEMRQAGDLSLSEAFCNNLIKAAPMHDLGKVAVDDAILRKPGRFTPEEFEQMKKHAAEGAKIVKKVLSGTDDQAFCEIATNVAHYHHERWDGSGYPEKLKGEEIPLEARIMAVADVYDALVSKRVYKESMSFEEADHIIMEGMGSQFDKRLEKYYVAARPALEEFYTKYGAE